MRVAVGCDHRGIEVKNWVIEKLEQSGFAVVDCGAYSNESCDYPDIAEKVGTLVGVARVNWGVLICGTGIGMSIAANKLPGVRAALCCNPQFAALARNHNDANILCLAANDAQRPEVDAIVESFFQANFEDGRHAHRVAKIRNLEQQDNAAVVQTSLDA